MGDGGKARIQHDLVQGLKEEFGEGVYAYAIERLIWFQDQGDEFGVNMWRNVLADLDEINKGEGQ
jgi:hypothetical protein